MTHKERKHVRDLLKGARKLQHANTDILSARDNARLTQAFGELDTVFREKDDSRLEHAVEQLERRLERNFPRQKQHRIRENVEVFLVAVVVAMAVRTYFLQPFKIPTGSMQPTLYGIHSPSAEHPPGEDTAVPKPPPLNVLEWLIWGKSAQPDPKSPTRWSWQITGDHIFVDKVSYNFRKPKRGAVIVFQTQGITGLDPDKFYIKRCVGLPGNQLEIRPPFLYINGEKVDGGPFNRIYSMQNGYHGYTYPRGQWPRAYALPPEGMPLAISAECYFACGDNSANSLDSRYWGCVPESNLVGKALWTYWPISKRWGLVK